MNIQALYETPTYKSAVHSSIFQEAQTGSSIVRGLKVIPFSLLITLGLLLCMYALIKNDDEYIEPPTESPKIIDFVMKKTPPIENEYSKPIKPVEPPVQPPMPPQEFEPVNPGSDTSIQVGRVTPEIKRIGPGDFGGDQLMPLIKVQPNYPTTATTRGIEGFVDVIFDVTAMGTTENIRIAYAEPSSVFNRSVIQALQRWKFKPKMVDGNPVKAFDVRDRIVFKLE